MMIEKVVLDYLKSKGFEAYMERNNEIEGDFILIEKTGSGEENHIKNSTLAIQSFSDSLYNTAALNEKVKETMKQIIELEEVCRCTLNSDYNYTLSNSKEYRYQAVFDLVHY